MATRDGEFLRTVALRALSGDTAPQLRVLVRELLAKNPEAAGASRLAEEIIDAAAARNESDHALRASETRLAEAQRIARMGSYDWDIVADTNAWSDELYRIYGTEPQSFNASYERFIGFVHPDDRPGVMEVHRAAYASGEPFQTEERIVRPDGEVRQLATWGEVLQDSAGHPIRMRGICRDVTEQRAAEVALGESLQRFEALVESSPDVVLVVDKNGTIIQANTRVRALLGYEVAEICGRPIETLLPSRFHDAHEAHRKAFVAAPRSRAMGVGLELFARHADGTEVPVDVALGAFSTADGPAVTAFVRDSTERKHAEVLALRLHDADVRRRHGLEINDNVVQGLTAAIYGLEAGRRDEATAALHQTLASARAMMNDLLGASGEALLPGALRRAEPSPRAPVGRESTAPVAESDPAGGPGRVLIVDDAADIRLLMRIILRKAGFTVVGEAADGAEGARLAGELQPGLVLLDLSMPVMDGLEALPVIRERAPGAKVIVLSGFDRGRMEGAAMAAGADAYMEKGSATEQLVALASSLCPAGSPPPETGPEDDSTADSALTHELRTPLTVIQGIASTLRTNADALPSGAFSELLDALARNADHMAAMLDTLSDAFRLGAGGLDLTTEPIDLGQLAVETIRDLAPILAGHRVEFETSRAVEVTGDRSRLRQVVTNLLTNAVRFTPPGTPITVTVDEAADMVELVCADAGPGVAEERRSELFGRFARLGQSVPGMGLGLFLSRGIARAHGGDLVYRDAPGGGATFVLTVPKADRPVVAPGGTEGHHLAGGDS